MKNKDGEEGGGGGGGLIARGAYSLSSSDKEGVIREGGFIEDLWYFFILRFCSKK